MSDKKNMVIKVRYPTSGKSPEEEDSAPRVITEWNFQRIGMVLAGLVLAGLLIHFFTGVDKSEDDSKNAETPVVAEALKEPESASADKVNNTLVKPKPVQVNKKETEISSAGNVTRVQLTNAISKNEPVGKVVLPLKIGKKEKVGIYYFAELKGMKGKTIYHEWILNDNLVSRKKVNISADPWRTSSKQAIAYTMNNDWKVRLVDEAGNSLNEIAFNLELK